MSGPLPPGKVNQGGVPGSKYLANLARTATLGLSKIVNFDLNRSQIDVCFLGLVRLEQELLVEGELAHATLDRTETNGSLGDTGIGPDIWSKIFVRIAELR